MADLPEEWNNDVAECHQYLRTGGLGEVMGLTLMYAKSGAPKVQNDTDLEWAILELAAEGLDARKKKEAN